MKGALSGSDTLMVPGNTVKRLAKSRAKSKGMRIKISRANIRKQPVVAIKGEGIFSALMPVLKTVAPTVGKNFRLICFSCIS